MGIVASGGQPPRESPKEVYSTYHDLFFLLFFFFFLSIFFSFLFCTSIYSSILEKSAHLLFFLSNARAFYSFLFFTYDKKMYDMSTPLFLSLSLSGLLPPPKKKG